MSIADDFFPVAMVNMQGSKSNAVAQEDGPSYTLAAMHGHDVHVVAFLKSGPRRLTGTECERLQGIPDGYTRIPFRNMAEPADCPRNRSLGNSMAVNCMDWIGHRIQEIICEPLPFDTTQITSRFNYSNPRPGDPCHPLAAGAHPPAVATHYYVRRLSPSECDMLQGFPRGYTEIGDLSSESSRYKSLGNSMAVNCMSWLGDRINTGSEM